MILVVHPDRTVTVLSDNLNVGDTTADIYVVSPFSGLQNCALHFRLPNGAEGSPQFAEYAEGTVLGAGYDGRVYSMKIPQAMVEIPGTVELMVVLTDNKARQFVSDPVTFDVGGFVSLPIPDTEEQGSDFDAQLKAMLTGLTQMKMDTEDIIEAFNNGEYTVGFNEVIANIEVISADQQAEVAVETSGQDTAKNIAFHFKIPRDLVAQDLLDTTKKDIDKKRDKIIEKDAYSRVYTVTEDGGQSNEKLVSSWENDAYNPEWDGSVVKRTSGEKGGRFSANDPVFPFDVVNFKTLLDKAHPVHSLAFYIDNTNPAELNGGYWLKIKDKFILAAGDIYAAGTTGGSNIFRITEENLPGGIITFKQLQASQWSTGLWGHYGQTVATHGATPIYQHSESNNNTIKYEQAIEHMPPYYAVNVWVRVTEEEFNANESL